MSEQKIMRIFNPTTGPRPHRLGFLLSFVLTMSTGLWAAQPPGDWQNHAELQADCRIEGEAGGLSAADLDQFIQECVADLLSVEFSNTEE